MKKALMALAAGASLAATAAPALAQDFGSDLQHREDSLRMRIERGAEVGTLRPGEAARLNTELNTIVDLDQRYRYEGMDGGRFRDLSSRLSLLDSRLNYDVTMNTGDW